jgi:hypothetical protein
LHDLRQIFRREAIQLRLRSVVVVVALLRVMSADALEKDAESARPPVMREDRRAMQIGSNPLRQSMLLASNQASANHARIVASVATDSSAGSGRSAKGGVLVMAMDVVTTVVDDLVTLSVASDNPVHSISTGPVRSIATVRIVGSAERHEWPSVRSNQTASVGHGVNKRVERIGIPGVFSRVATVATGMRIAPRASAIEQVAFVVAESGTESHPVVAIGHSASFVDSRILIPAQTTYIDRKAHTL